jgi:importin subunit alpha-1
LVLRERALPQLLHLLETRESVELLRNATWALSNLCRGKEPRVALERIAPAISTLLRLARHADADVVTDACWALVYLSEDADQLLHAVLEAGICPLLVELLRLVASLLRNPTANTCAPRSKPQSSWLIPALRAAGNVCARTSLKTQLLINAGILGRLGPLLAYDRVWAVI